MIQKVINSIIDQKLEKIYNSLVDLCYESNIELIKISDLTYCQNRLSDSIGSIVDEVQFQNKHYVFKEIHHDLFSEDIDNKLEIASCAYALKKGREIYPQHFPELKGIVVSDKGEWKGVLVELLGKEYIELTEKQDLSIKTVSKIESVMKNMHSNGIFCDILETNIFLKGDDFILIDPMFSLKFQNFVFDWYEMNIMKEIYAYKNDIFNDRITTKKITAYMTVFNYLWNYSFSPAHSPGFIE